MECIDFENDLKKIYDHTLDNDMKFQSPEACIMNIQEHIKSCKEFISNFFSKKEVGDGIKYFYKLIREKDGLNTIKIVDLYYVANLYDEYNTGMLDFLNDVITLVNYNYQNETEKTRCEDLLEKAKIKDRTFIDSIFGGENNPKKDVTITDAIKNIEFLVDYFGYLEHLSQKLNDLANTVETNQNCELLLESFNLLRSSLLYYWYLLFNRSIITYIDIDTALNNKSSDDRGAFKLF